MLILDKIFPKKLKPMWELANYNLTEEEKAKQYKTLVITFSIGLLFFIGFGFIQFSNGKELAAFMCFGLAIFFRQLPLISSRSTVEANRKKLDLSFTYYAINVLTTISTNPNGSAIGIMTDALDVTTNKQFDDYTSIMLSNWVKIPAVLPDADRHQILLAILNDWSSNFSIAAVKDFTTYILRLQVNGYSSEDTDLLIQQLKNEKNTGIEYRKQILIGGMDSTNVIPIMTIPVFLAIAVGYILTNMMTVMGG